MHAVKGSARNQGESKEQKAMTQPGKGGTAGGAMRRKGRQLRLRRGPLCPGFVSSVMPTREDAAIKTCKK